MASIYSRRKFLNRSAQLSSALMLAGSSSLYANEAVLDDKFGKVLPRRKLGKTSLKPTIYTVGGWHVGRQSELNAQAIIDKAIKQGVRFFDTANQYQDGQSERYYGKFLTPKYGQEIEIMTKSAAKTPEVLIKHLNQSFESLKVDQIDLVMIHSITFFGNGNSGKKYKDIPRVIPEKVSIAKAHHFALSLPISTLVSGVDTPQQVDDNLKSIWEFKALTTQEQNELIQACRPAALTGKMENFKA